MTTAASDEHHRQQLSGGSSSAVTPVLSTETDPIETNNVLGLDSPSNDELVDIHKDSTPDDTCSKDTSHPPTPTSAVLDSKGPVEDITGQVVHDTKTSSSPETRHERRCWVCFGDDSEDGSASMRWVKPCKCRGSIMWCHEDCLLRYIQSRKDSLKPVECPQCHTVYMVVEPNPFLLKFLTWGDSALQSLMPYLTFLGVTSSALILFTSYGAYAFMTLTGDDATLATGDWSLRTWLGLPMIPVMLVFSRTEFLDPIFPAVPLILLRHHTLEVRWPPSRGLVLAVLPWLRAVYNGLYGKIYSRATGRRYRDGFRRPSHALLHAPLASHHSMGTSAAVTVSVSTMNNRNNAMVTANGRAMTEPVNAARVAVGAASTLLRHSGSSDDLGSNAHDVPTVLPEPASNTAPERESEALRTTESVTTTTTMSDGGSTMTTTTRTSPDSGNDEETEYETVITERRDLGRIIMGALALPALSSGVGSLLTRLRFIKTSIPDSFHRNVLGGCLFVLLKDICLLTYVYLKRRQCERRRVRNYNGDL